MTRQEIEAVFERVKTWPEDRQAWAAWLLLDYEKLYDEPDEIFEDESRALDEAEREIARGEVASDEEFSAVLDRFRQL